jgi:manganese efflux pump family protein
MRPGPGPGLFFRLTRLPGWFILCLQPSTGQDGAVHISTSLETTLTVILTIFVLAVAVAMDAFAVSLGLGTCCEIKALRGKLRLAAHFGIFQSGMTALGWVTANTIVHYVEKLDHWLAFVLLAYVGGKLIIGGFQPDKPTFEQDPSTGRTMVMLSFATSIDAFAVGLSLVAMQVPTLATILTIGLLTAALSLVGLFTGTRLGEAFGKRMEIVGGVILILIGIQVLYSHLTS